MAFSKAPRKFHIDEEIQKRQNLPGPGAYTNETRWVSFSLILFFVQFLRTSLCSFASLNISDTRLRMAVTLFMFQFLKESNFQSTNGFKYHDLTASTICMSNTILDRSCDDIDLHKRNGEHFLFESVF